jgi:hypothetical protein
VGRVLELLNFVWIEEPLDAYDYEGHAMLAQSLDTPIATGEMLTSVAEHMGLITNISTQASLPIEEEPDRPDLSKLQGALCADLLPGIPRPSILRGSYCEGPIAVLRWPHWLTGQQTTKKFSCPTCAPRGSAGPRGNLLFWPTGDWQVPANTVG